MSVDVYQKSAEEQERKDQELKDLKEEMSKMRQNYESYSNQVKGILEKFDMVVKQRDESIDFLSKELDKYRSQFGPRPLTNKEREKLREMKAAIDALPPGDYYED